MVNVDKCTTLFFVVAVVGILFFFFSEFHKQNILILHFLCVRCYTNLIPWNLESPQLLTPQLMFDLVSVEL